jgi:hypothetical protein
MKESYFKNEYAEIWLENGIICARHNSASFTFDMAQKLVEERLKISAGISRPILIDVKQCISIDVEAREYLSEGDSLKFVRAGAFLIDNPITKFIGNIFINVNRPTVPSKLFTDLNKALKWLEQFK